MAADWSNGWLTKWRSLSASCVLPSRAQKNHKVVLNFDDLLKFSEEVRQCEEDQLQGMYRGAMF